jgi:hypothetical protein
VHKLDPPHTSARRADEATDIFSVDLTVNVDQPTSELLD